MHDPLHTAYGRQAQQTVSFTTDWIKRWILHGRLPNRPDLKRIPRTLDYLYRYNLEAAYTHIRDNLESQKSYKRRLYNGLLQSINPAMETPQMRIHKLWKDTDWIKVWKNLGEAPIPDQMRCIWYQVIHDIIPNNVRLHRNKMTPTNICQSCVETDTLGHRLTVCDEGRPIWNHTKTAIARMLRTKPDSIPTEWLLRLQFKLWPAKRNRAVLWTVSSVVSLRLRNRTTLTLQDYMDFLVRSRWKLLKNRRGRELVGNYLADLDPMYTVCTTGIGDT